ncbi:alpha/beta fold hydrolase [Brevibacterium litoralis]|uniref:alpha/beta fold hydrolase n=1 Tax=Brevibacterium litoralis TaxID=3138935 RepID=UPI0032F02B55
MDTQSHDEEVDLLAMDGLPTTRVEVGDLSFSVIDVGPGSTVEQDGTGKDVGEPGDPGKPDHPVSTVILLHGFPDRALMWRHQIRSLVAAGHRVIAPDQRGFGDSDRPEGVAPYHLSHLMKDVLGIADALGVDRFRLAGHDFGSLVGWMLATAHPDRVERYAALSVGHPRAFSGAGFEQKQKSWYVLWFQHEEVEPIIAAEDFAWFRTWSHGGAARGRDADADRQIDDLSRPGALRAALSWYRANMPPRIFTATAADRSDLPTVSCPVMGVWSDADIALTERQMTDSQWYVDGDWRYERIDGTDHWMSVHAPEKVSALLVDFFA